MRSYPKIDIRDRKRLIFIIFFVFFLFGLIVIQFYHLQINEKDKWHKIASSQHHIEVMEHFMRGCFYSNVEIKKDHLTKVPFNVEIPKFHLYVDPYLIDKKYKLIIAKKLFEFFHLSQEEKEKIFCDFFKKSRSRKIISWIDKEKKDEIFKWWRDFSKKEKILRNAIFFVNDYKRSYPFGSLLGQVLHTIQEQKDPNTFQALPTGGLELYFDDYLKGKLGRRVVTRSLKYPLDIGNVVEKPENGSDIYLTINHYLQTISEEELEKGIKVANAKGGWAIMLDPYTAEILALAQYPFFDVRKYNEYFNNDNLNDITKPKAVVDLFEPGSIMKPITLAICLKANEELIKKSGNIIFYPDEKIATSNGNFPGRTKPLKDGRLHNYLNMYLAIQKSSNIYFATIIDRLINTLGDKWYEDALVDMFGFSKKTEIELPAEAKGFVPSVGRQYNNKKPQWSKSTPYSLAIGYNILVNSIQILKAYAIIANEGLEIKPTLLKKIVKNDEVILDNSNKKFDKRVLSKESCWLIKQAMKFTTKAGGTSPLGDIYGYTEAGKSGTAEKNINGKYEKNKHISSFIGLVPVEKPRFVLMVVVDEPEKKYVPGIGKMQHGGACASPIFKEIATRSLKYLGVAPDDPFGYPCQDPRRDFNKADWSKEMRYLSNLYKSWNKK